MRSMSRAFAGQAVQVVLPPDAMVFAVQVRQALRLLAPLVGL